MTRIRGEVFEGTSPGMVSPFSCGWHLCALYGTISVMNIIVQTTDENATRGVLICGTQRFDCALGRGGVTTDKVEGDGKTPIGTYPLRLVFYRADRVARPDTGLLVRELTPSTGWSEDPASADYNTEISVPPCGQTPDGIDRMTRDDHVYDITVVIGYNDDPPVKGRGSAIFMHVARPGYTPTAGCVALSESDLLTVLGHMNAQSQITILPPPVR